ncbi:MAG TPA: aldolase/citrate lyase family protein [Steroidobacteraceae bacterium]|nr:aldolase/citrate lyase family protein [Steroidobacteraceae bacterium]
MKRWKNPRAVRSRAATRVADALLLGRTLRRKIASGCALGTFLIEQPAASTIATLAIAGFDFVVLDMEHSAIDFSTLEPLILAAHGAGLPALVRTCGNQDGFIGKILDMGAHGIMVPHVDSAERARAIVDQARFPPLGKRGFSPLSKFDALVEPLRALNRSTFVVVQIEGRGALGAVRQIAAVPGIDATFIGPYDLALSLAVPPGSAPVIAAAERMAAEVRDDVTLGIYVDDPAASAAWAARGFALQCVSFDGRMLSSGARIVVETARQGFKAGGRRRPK